MKRIIIVLMVLGLVNYGLSWQIKLIKQIPIKNLYQSAFFVVLDDGNFLFTDIHDKNAQLKIFNADGQLMKAWGKMGPGPDEYEGLGFPDYSKPYLAVSDAGRHRIHIFEKIANYEFKKIGEVFSWEQSGNIKIYDKNILISGFIVSPEGKKYSLFMKDFSNRETRYILPLEYTYGGKSMAEHKKISDEVSGISVIHFFDVYEDFVFYVSDVRLKIIKINLRSNKIEVFGEEPKNFHPVRIDKKTRESLLKNPEIFEEIMNNNSFVGGIFADKEFVGTIFVNREKEKDHKRYYVAYAQIYDQAGKLYLEQPLTQFYSEERIIPLFYQKDNRLLYLCSITYDQESVIYTIYQYRVEP